MNAKVVLIYDKNIMELDVLNMTTSIYEALLITTTASDWSYRAWTFFEAFRARRTLHLLCHKNAVVSLNQVIKSVSQNGSLEIGVLCLAMPHFLSPFDIAYWHKISQGGQGRIFKQVTYLSRQAVIF